MNKLLESFEIISIGNAILLALFLFSAKSENKKSNAFLGLFLLSLSLEILSSFNEGALRTVYILPATSLFTIVLLFYYVKSTVGEKITDRLYLLLIPAIVQNVLLYFFYKQSNLFVLIEYGLNIFLLIRILRIQQRHVKKLQDFYSDLEHKSLSWIKTIALAFIAFYVLWITEDIIGFFIPAYVSLFVDASLILTFFVVIWISYIGFEHNEIFRIKLFSENIKRVKSEIETQKTNHIKEAPRNSGQEESFNKIKQEIKERKLYRNPKLNLRLLAEQLDIKEKQLSGLMNQYAQMNFYTFINSFRIEEFKELLDSPKGGQLSILGLAKEVGFSSKSTFYSAFKTLVGMTPTEFQLKKRSE